MESSSQYLYVYVGGIAVRAARCTGCARYCVHGARCTVHHVRRYVQRCVCRGTYGRQSTPAHCPRLGPAKQTLIVLTIACLVLNYYHFVFTYCDTFCGQHRVENDLTKMLSSCHRRRRQMV